jgi:ankyrin repeat protein
MSIWVQRAVEYSDVNRIRQTLDSIDSFSDAETKLICNGHSLLSIAIESNQPKAFDVLLDYHNKHGVSVDLRAKTSGTCALHTAVLKNNKTFCEKLILNGAFASIKDRRGRTPLHLAIEKQFHDIIKLLVRFGANIHAKNAKGNVVYVTDI